MAKDYYRILGVSRSSGPEEIKKAFRRLAMLYHPDRNPGNREAEAFFLEMREAYETLYDPGKRRIYDAGPGSAMPERSDLPHRFEAAVDRARVRVFEEVRLSYTYTGEGRVFLKPKLDGFFMTGPPFVAFSKTRLAGTEVKETTLTYIIAPERTGTLTIAPASIRIDNRVHLAGPLNLDVVANECYYRRGKPADGRPFRYRMHYESVTGTAKRRALKNVNHTVLIPRSHYAAVNHVIGRALKIVSAFWGMALAVKIGVPVVYGGAGGLLFGGAACQLFYLVTGVRPRFYYSRKHPLVQGYLHKGYRSGSDSGSQFINSEWLYFVNSLIG